MKKKLLHILLAFTGFILNAQNYTPPELTISQNYIYTVTPQHPFQINTLEEVLAGRQIATGDKIIESVNYFDGLGRPLEEVAIGITPLHNDIITFHMYDNYGREVEKWLPFALDNNGKYSTAYGTAPSYIAHSFYQDYRTYMFLNFPFGNIPVDTEPSAKTVFDNSPLNRVVEQGFPGLDWRPANNESGHTIKTVYSTNSIADDIPLFYAVNDTLLKGTNYAIGSLYKTITKDENWQPAQSNLKDHTTEEFKNKQGQVVLKRTYDNNLAHDTYYVYDYSGNLTFVLPPKAEAGSATLTTINSVLDDLCYQYKYDYKNRLIEKKLPGKETESIVYNNLDQPILTQDAIQKAKGEWLFTKYDAFGRVAYTGKATNTINATRETVQNQVNAFTGTLWVTQSTTISSFGGTDIYYNNGAYPNNSGSIVNVSEIFTINYYDSYVDRPAGVPNSIVIMESPTNETNTVNVKSLLTTSKVKVLDVTGTNVWITNVNYYDSKARPVYTYSENAYLGTVDITEIKLDFTAKTLKTKATHIRNEKTIAIIDNFTYDHAGRLNTHTQCIGDENMGYACSGNSATQLDLNLTGIITSDQVASRSITVTNGTILPNTTLSINPGKQELIVLNNYDELGQLNNKKVGGVPAAVIANSDGLQTVDFKYNIRGWLKSINDINTIGTDLFAFQIDYNDILDASKKLFNGNISQTQSKTANTDTTLKGYIYEYDALNRLINAIDNSVNNPNRYNEIMSYDKNGNITSLVRKGNTNLSATTFGTMDNLSYTYDTGNKLTKVEDSSGSTEGFNNGTTGSNIDYSYDLNGNMIVDNNKNITNIKYNYLNLPTEIKFQNDDIIKYIYNAQGKKQKKIVLKNGDRTETSYAGNYQYLQEFEGGGLPVLKFFSQPEGYVERKENSFKYVYQYKDHLGNIRLSYSDSNNDGTIATSEILEENNYYAFGLKQQNGNNLVNSTNPALKYKYNGKELQDELGLNMYDYGARNYDPALGRWMNIDNMAEKYYDLSPYNYTINNPVNVIDPDGNDIYLLIWFSKNNETGHAGIAIDNYKTVNKKDANGNNILDKNGKAVTEQVKDGTYTYFDLWPNDAVGDTELQDNVGADYTKGIKINNLKDLMSKDPTGSRNGNVSAEGRAADGIVQIPSAYNQDEAAKGVAEKDIKNNKDYNGCNNNCSTYAQRIINSVYPSLNASQTIKPSGFLRTIYNDSKTVAPNNLYNAALKIKGATNLKGPTSVTAKPYLEYFGKSNRP